MSEALNLVDTFFGVKITRTNGSVTAAFPRQNTKAYTAYAALKPDVPSAHTERHHPGPNVLLSFKFNDLKEAAATNPALAGVLEMVERAPEAKVESTLA
jgi:hypothetical protein